MAAGGGVDVSRSSLSVKKDHDFYRNGARGDGERRPQTKPPLNEQGLRRFDGRNRSRLVSEKGEEEGQRPAEKRRKFSPILWDDVEDKVSKAPTSREKTRSSFTSLTTNPTCKQNVDVTLTRKTSPKDQVNVMMSPEPVEAQGPGILNQDVDVTVSSRTSPKDQVNVVMSQEFVDELEEGQLEEEQQVTHISPVKKLSRWETGLTSHNEEVVSHTDNVVPKTSRWNRSSLSPECGELVVSEERQSNSSGSGSGHQSVEKLSANGYSDHEYCSSPNDELEAEEPASPAQGVMNMLLGSRSVNGFQKLNKINEGTYGIVYRARDEKTKEIVALKKIKMKEDKYEEEYGFPLTSLREINILLSCNHPSIVNVKEVVVGGKNDSDVYMVMEHLEHDLKCLMERKKQPFSTSEVKCLMLQLLEGVHYLHTNWIIHRDLKPSNLLMNNTGELKICDFGMARQYGSPIKPYTQMVITQWYRPPELLLGAKQYSTAVDMWSIGCIMAELLSQKPLFPGKTELDQLQKIFAVLGTPNESIWPGFSSLPNAKAKFPTQSYNLLRKKFPAISFVGGQILSERGFDLLNGLLTLDPEKRLTVEEALNHSWFHEVPLPKSQDFMPTFPPRR
ncbi:cyclin-dependent kinase G1 [Raphanus sativus]|uniref:cyclin-dependent kinase n=1 Tax=Raphanus sativus TaxID=3726 RepID=A0A9W3C0B7_RAPSA|nr:cyclin-dependent kinase G1 [Raphanus sativus]